MTNLLKFRINLISVFCLALPLLSACSAAKIEARLEANPQCKDIVNPKTGAVMPCPGTDKAFYAAAGLGPKKAAPTNSSVDASNLTPSVPDIAGSATSAPASVATSDSTSVAAPSQPPDCKPKLHQKSGSLMPCPAP
ncbi:hypothetical protein [Polynucleobacter asymbioticus]|uniref:hypothetical protein n=1 Tax=Polynucleobacter asymbioticus TaxID=576611 RepID=UPI001D11F419|nr:hypothetical protein [Polynucleobacter asymbioticus]